MNIRGLSRIVAFQHMRVLLGGRFECLSFCRTCFSHTRSPFSCMDVQCHVMRQNHRVMDPPRISSVARVAVAGEATRAGCGCGYVLVIHESSSDVTGTVFCRPKQTRKNMCTSRKGRRRITSFQQCQTTVLPETPASCRKLRHECTCCWHELGNSMEEVQGTRTQRTSIGWMSSRKAQMQTTGKNSDCCPGTYNQKPQIATTETGSTKVTRRKKHGQVITLTNIVLSMSHRRGA